MLCTLEKKQEVIPEKTGEHAENKIFKRVNTSNNTDNIFT